jgi:transcription initiation factor IIE alpha subunit
MTKEPTESLFGCDLCDGTKRIKTILESGQEISMPCPKCGKGMRMMTNTEMLECWSVVRMYIMDTRDGDYDKAMEAINKLIKELKDIDGEEEGKP